MNAAGKESKIQPLLKVVIIFYTDIHANLVDSQTGYDVIGYFQLTFVEV